MTGNCLENVIINDIFIEQANTVKGNGEKTNDSEYVKFKSNIRPYVSRFGKSKITLEITLNGKRKTGH